VPADQPPKILIVEDEEALARGLKLNFELEGYDPIVCGDGRSALGVLAADDHGVKLVVLDLMLPGMSGYEVCRTIRETDDQLPILVLSARTLAEDKIQAFDLGTDQYMTKPFALPELLSRVRNLLARRPSHLRDLPNPGDVRVPAQHRFGRVDIDFDKFEVTVAGQEGPPATHPSGVAGTVHRLTTLEMQLLRFFVEHEGKVLSRSQILKEVWDEQADITTRSIDNFVLRLRRILEVNPAEPRHILSVRGTGYRFVASPEDGTLSD
jgi:DNA-binding response OmpR family regulator